MNKRRKFIKDLFVSGMGIGLLSGFRYDLSVDPKVSWGNLKHLFSIKDGLRYFNSATLGLSPLAVTKSYKDSIDMVNSTGSYSNFKKPLQEKLAKFIGCTPEEIALTKNVTEGLNVANWAIDLKEGDEVIICDQEHAGSAIPWFNRAEKDKVVIKVAKLGRDGGETIKNIAELISKRTKVIAMPHMPCTTGHVLPIKDICALARSINAYSIIDGAHGMGMLQLNMKRLGCDFYAGCFHKWMLGPKGSGFLYVNRAKLAVAESYFVGAHSDVSWNLNDGIITYKGLRQDTAMRYTYGTQSDSIFAASLASIEFMETLGMSKVEKRIKKMGRELCQTLLENPKLEVFNSPRKSENAGIVSFKPRYKDAYAFYMALMDAQFRVRFVQESNLNCIRISTHLYNSEQDLNALVNKIEQLSNEA